MRVTGHSCTSIVRFRTPSAAAHSHFGVAGRRLTLDGLHCELRAMLVGSVRSGDGLRESLDFGKPSINEAARHNPFARPNLSGDNTEYSSHQTKAYLLIESATDETASEAMLSTLSSRSWRLFESTS